MTDRSMNTVDHRPWPLPSRPWVMTQRWHDLLFAHWPLPPDTLYPHVPSTLTLDTFDGVAWIGVVPFRMSHVTLRGLPALPWLSAFPELNVRTYVIMEDKPGVYFFSLDVSNPVAVVVARWWFHLPYFRARMTCTTEGHTVHYRSSRTYRGGPRAEFVGRYWPCGDIFRTAPGTLEHWLTERYCLYAADARQRLYRGEIHHRPWPLQPAEVEIAVNTMAAAHKVALPDTPPLAHVARQLEVLIWAPQRVC